MLHRRTLVVFFFAATTVTADLQDMTTACLDGECKMPRAQALLQSRSATSGALQVDTESTQKPGTVGFCLNMIPVGLPKSGDHQFQQKSWRSGCLHAWQTGNSEACKPKCSNPKRGCCGTTCNKDSCTGGGCCEASAGICEQACDVFFMEPVSGPVSGPQTTPAPETTAAPATTEAPDVEETTEAPASTEAPYVEETTEAPASTEAPYVEETTRAPYVSTGSEGKCTPTCSWQCVSPECERTCKPKCQQPQCETRCKKEDTTGCAMNCTEPECWTICPKAACKKTENCPLCTTHCSEAVCRLDCPQTQDCENVCEAPVCEWECDIPEACPQPDCRLDCQEPKDCMNGGISGAPLPALKDGEIKVHSFSSPVNMREPTGAMLEMTGESLTNVPVMVFTRGQNYMTTLPVLQSAA